jgi:hypothetical protein
MNYLESDTPLRPILHKLGFSQLTDDDIQFIIRRLRCDVTPEARANLIAECMMDEASFREREQRVMLQLSFDGLMQVESWLDGWAGDDYIKRLTLTERRNLRWLVDEALALHTPDAAPKQTLPMPLFRDSHEKALTASRPAGEIAPTKLRRTFEAPFAGTRSKESSTPETGPILQNCPVVMVSRHTQPDQLLVSLFDLYNWLSGAHSTLSNLHQFMSEKGHLRGYSQLQQALDFLYVVGIIAPMTARQMDALVPITLTANLTVSQFRRACAEKFTQRIQGNREVLAAIDQLNDVSLNRIKQIVFTVTQLSDLPVRLIVWEAFGLIEQQKKKNWQITQAGRTLVATLPPVHFVLAQGPDQVSAALNHDWLDIL